MGETTIRSETDGFGKVIYDDESKVDHAIIGALEQVAKARGVKMASVALAWHFTKPEVAAPIIGASKTHHIGDAVAALDLELTSEEISTLEGAYCAKFPTDMGMPMPPLDKVTVLGS